MPFSPLSRSLLLWLLSTLLLPVSAVADVHVYSPIVDQGEYEIETRADQTSDHRPELNHARSAVVDLGYGVTSFWATEIEMQWQQAPQEGRKYDSTAWENRFQLTPQGAYWLDAGLFLEYEKVAKALDHDSISAGLLLQKEFGQNLTTANFLLHRELGGAPGLNTDVRLQSVWRLNPAFQPGLELYLEPGRLGHFERYENERLRLGPVIVGTLRTGQLSKLKYELGYLQGATRASEQGTLRAQLEYEVRF